MPVSYIIFFKLSRFKTYENICFLEACAVRVRSGGYGGLGTGYDVRGTVVRCRGYGGYCAGVRWVRWRGAVGTVEGAMGTVDGYGGYGGGVLWILWTGTTVGTVRVWVTWMGTVHTVEGVRGYGERVVVYSPGAKREVYIASSS